MAMDLVRLRYIHELFLLGLKDLALVPCLTQFVKMFTRIFLCHFQ